MSVSRADTNTSQQALKGRRNHFAAEKYFTNVSAKYDLVGLNDIFYTWASTKRTVLFVFSVEVNVYKQSGGTEVERANIWEDRGALCPEIR